MSRPTKPPRETEAERLRRLRLTFERAVADNCTMQQAAYRRWREADAERARRLKESRERIDRAMPAPAPAAFIPVDDSDDGLKWFQR